MTTDNAFRLFQNIPWLDLRECGHDFPSTVRNLIGYQEDVLSRSGLECRLEV
jgi:hypothetical protein